DLVVMVATAGQNAAAAAIIGEACSVKRVMTTALILAGASPSDEALSKMLAQLRPHVMMLVISSADEYIEDMLTALRAGPPHEPSAENPGDRRRAGGRIRRHRGQAHRCRRRGDAAHR